MALKSDNRKAEWQLLRFAWLTAHGNHLAIAITMLLQIGIGLLPASVTYVVQTFVSTDGVPIKSMITVSNMIIAVGGIIAFILVKQFIAAVMGYVMANVKRNIEQEYIIRLNTLDYEQVHDTMDNRNVAAIARESDMVSALIPMVYHSFIKSPVTIIAFLILIFWISPYLTAVVLLMLAVVVLCSQLLRRKIRKASRMLYDRFSDMYQSFAEWLRGYRVFLLNDAKDYASENLSTAINDTCDFQKRIILIKITQTVIIEILTYLVVFVFLIVFASIDTWHDWRFVISFPAAIIFIRKEAIALAEGYVQLVKTEGATKRLMQIFATTSKQSKDKAWDEKINEITLSNTNFAYSENISVLTDASLTITSGAGIYVLVGESGVGKSTTFDLIMSLRNLNSGVVKFNGQDISQYNTKTLLKHIAFVEQEPFLFNGTLQENLTFSTPINTEQVLQLFAELKMSHIASCPEDLKREIRTEGNNLSVGEKQRIAFIRALLKNPDVILLDEMTSSVDSETAKIMLDFLQHIANEKIIFCISHDSRVTDKANQIIHLRNGKFEIEK